MVVLIGGTAMDADGDTFVTTVYVIVDELYQTHYAPQKPVRPGHRPEVSDSEILTLGLLAQWQRSRSERAFLRAAHRSLRAYFPRLLSQSAFNRRLRDLAGVLAHLVPAVAARTTALLGASAYQVLDGVPVPLARRCRGQRHRLFAAEAAIGRGGSEHAWFFGQRLLLAVDAHGQITGAVSGPANTEERFLADALLRWRVDATAPAPTAAELDPVLGPAHRRQGSRQGPTGPLLLRGAAGAPAAGPYLGDLGYCGADWARHWRTDYGARVLTKADYRPGPAGRPGRRWVSGLRQVVETVNGWLGERFGLNFPRARTAWGLQTRLAAKLAAFNLAVHVNHLHGRPTFAAVELWG
jgi:hypothetical protein